MKNKFFLLCMFATLACTSCAKDLTIYKNRKLQEIGVTENKHINVKNTKKSNLTSREQKLNGEYLTPTGMHFNVNALGKGIDLVKNDIIHPNANDIKAGSYIFDPEWLITKYDEAASNLIINGRISHIYTSGTNMTEMIESTRTEFSNTASIDASYSSYAAGLKNTVHTSTSSSAYACTSFMYVSDRISYDAFKIDMPELESNKRLYINHLSEGFTSFIQDIIDNNATWLELFDIFGTHVLSSASFGGYCYLDYEVKSSRTILSFEDSLDFSLDIEAKGSYEGIDFDARDELETKLLHKYELSQGELSLNIKQSFVGGPSAYCIPAFDPDDICWRTTEWLSHVDEDVKITRFLRAAPIWNYIPYSISNRSQIIEQAVEAYNYYKTLNDIGPDFANNQTFSKTFDLINQTNGEKCHVGFAGTDRTNLMKSIDVINEKKLPSKELLLDSRFSYDNVNIKIDFDYKPNFPSITLFKVWHGLNPNQPTPSELLVSNRYDESQQSWFNTYRKHATIEFNDVIDENLGLFGVQPGLTLCFENEPYGFIGGETVISNLKVIFTFSSSQCNN